MKKRYRKPVAKDGELLVRYGKEYGDEDLFYCYPDNECGMKRDSKMLMLAFDEAWREKLTAVLGGFFKRDEHA